jgi:hypothetical protein
MATSDFEITLGWIRLAKWGNTWNVGDIGHKHYVAVGVPPTSISLQALLGSNTRVARNKFVGLESNQTAWSF